MAQRPGGVGTATCGGGLVQRQRERCNSKRRGSPGRARGGLVRQARCGPEWRPEAAGVSGGGLGEQRPRRMGLGVRALAGEPWWDSLSGRRAAASRQAASGFAAGGQWRWPEPAPQMGLVGLDGLSGLDYFFI